MQIDSLTVLNKIAQTIFDKKGSNILVLDVKGISTITDYFVIAEGSADRHVQALSKAIIEEMDEMGFSPAHVEGQKTGDWIVLDYVDIIIHLFMPGLREKYSLEEVWQEGKIVNVTIILDPAAKKKNL